MSQTEGQEKLNLRDSHGRFANQSEAALVKLDHELAAIKRLYDTLATLPAEARPRILRAVLVLMEIRPSELKE